MCCRLFMNPNAGIDAKKLCVDLASLLIGWEEEEAATNLTNPTASATNTSGGGAAGGAGADRGSGGGGGGGSGGGAAGEDAPALSARPSLGGWLGSVESGD